MRGGFLKGGLDLQTDALRALAATASDAPNKPSAPSSPSGPDLPGSALSVDTSPSMKPMGLGEVSTSVKTPSQRATELLMANQADMRAAGFEPVKMQNGAIRFVEAGKPGVFVSAENVLDLTNRQKARAQADRSGALKGNAASAIANPLAPALRAAFAAFPFNAPDLSA